MFYAEKENGAFFNNQRIRVSKKKELNSCLFATGGTSFNEVNLPIRKSGSAALDIAYVAAGRYDGYFQNDLNLYIDRDLRQDIKTSKDMISFWGYAFAFVKTGTFTKENQRIIEQKFGDNMKDKLINMISTKDIPGIGWAAGIERLMDLLPEYVSNTNSSKKILLALQKEEYLNNLGVLKQLYNSDYSHEIKVSSNIKKIFSYADKNDFDFLLLIGESEIQSNEIAVKDLNKKIQKTYSLKDFNLENEIR